jgi:hypothetical protein
MDLPGRVPAGWRRTVAGHKNPPLTVGHRLCREMATLAWPWFVGVLTSSIVDLMYKFSPLTHPTDPVVGVHWRTSFWGVVACRKLNIRDYTASALYRGEDHPFVHTEGMSEDHPFVHNEGMSEDICDGARRLFCIGTRGPYGTS